MPTTFVCIDTNIFFRFVTQGQPGCERECWDQFRGFIADTAVTLLVPEVVVLEFEAKVRRLKDDIAGKIGDARKRVIDASRKDLWNEIGDLPSFLEDTISQWMQSKITDAESRRDEIQRLLESSEAIRLPFDQELMLRSKKRMLSGRVKTAKDRGDADCLIIESLVRFFEGKGDDHQLLLCTENHKDFGVETKDGKKALHPLMKDGLPPTELFSDLASMVYVIKEHRKVVEPDPEEVKEAVEREKAEEEIEEAIGEALLEAAVPDTPTPRGLYATMRDMGWKTSLLRTIDPDTLKSILEARKIAPRSLMLSPTTMSMLNDMVKAASMRPKIDPATLRMLNDMVKAASTRRPAIHPTTLRMLNDMVKAGSTMRPAYDPAMRRAMSDLVRASSYLSTNKIPEADENVRSVISTDDVANLPEEPNPVEEKKEPIPPPPSA